MLLRIVGINPVINTRIPFNDIFGLKPKRNLLLAILHRVTRVNNTPKKQRK